MESTPLQRCKMIRELLGFTQDQWSEYTGIKVTRIKNAEKNNAKWLAEELEAVCLKFPELINFLVIEGDIELDKLSASKNEFLSVVAAKIKAKMAPELVMEKAK